MIRSPAPRLRVLACPNCGGTVELRAAGASISAVCSFCGSTIDVADNAALQVIAKAQSAIPSPPIAIGSRADLVGTLWEVIGYQLRSDPGHGWSWDEYLLFNPYEGFRFLVHDDPDWVLYAVLRQDVPDPARFDGRSYRALRSGQSRTDGVLGEFYWRARTGDLVASEEFESAPFLLSREQAADEVTWSRGLQLSSATVRGAFGLDAAIVPPTTPDRARLQVTRSRGVWLTFIVAVLLLLLSSNVSLDPNHLAVLFAAPVQAITTDRGNPIVGSPFTVPGTGGNVAIQAESNVSNGWVDLGWSLVDQQTQRTFNAATELSYYYGSDSDGAWTEGSPSGQAVLARIPGGTYRLLVDVNAPPQSSGADPVTITVRVIRHVGSALNFWLALIALAPYPIWRFLIDRARNPTGTAK